MLYTMENEQKYQLKAQKYKLKYSQLKAQIQAGGTPEFDLMDVIELYDKTFNLYVIYRFRYDNTLPLINYLNELGSIVYNHRMSPSIKKNYDGYYIKEMLNQFNRLIIRGDDGIADIHNYANDETKKKGLIFTLRQDTTKLLRDVLLINNESVGRVQAYIDLITALGPLAQDPVFQEILEKCRQIQGLVKASITEFNESVQPTSDDVLNLIRFKTNKIINIIGNDFDDSAQRARENQPNKISEDNNLALNILFNDCFKLIKQKLESISITSP